MPIWIFLGQTDNWYIGQALLQIPKILILASTYCISPELDVVVMVVCKSLIITGPITANQLPELAWELHVYLFHL